MGGTYNILTLKELPEGLMRRSWRGFAIKRYSKRPGNFMSI
jgi:hypothetical protein